MMMIVIHYPGSVVWLYITSVHCCQCTQVYQVDAVYHLLVTGTHTKCKAPSWWRGGMIVSTHVISPWLSITVGQKVGDSSEPPPRHTKQVRLSWCWLMWYSHWVQTAWLSWPTTARPVQVLHTQFDFNSQESLFYIHREAQTVHALASNHTTWHLESDRFYSASNFDPGKKHRMTSTSSRRVEWRTAFRPHLLGQGKQCIKRFIQDNFACIHEKS